MGVVQETRDARPRDQGRGMGQRLPPCLAGALLVLCSLASTAADQATSEPFWSGILTFYVRGFMFVRASFSRSISTHPHILKKLKI